jgi:hypothetical protein
MSKIGGHKPNNCRDGEAAARPTAAVPQNTIFYFLGFSDEGFSAFGSFCVAAMQPQPQPLCFLSAMGSCFFSAIFLTSFHQ